MTTPRRSSLLNRVASGGVNFLATALVARKIEAAQAGGQVSVVVVGARRSGHHAVLHWLANSLESDAVSWSDLRPDRVSTTATGRTIHLNNVVLPRRSTDNAVYARFLGPIRRAAHLVVNFEDVDPAAVDRSSWPVREPDLKVVVTRSTLNLVASRLERARGRADSVGYRVDEQLLDTLQACANPPRGWIVVNFDSWLINEDEYRARILKECGLHHDIDPTVSPFGRGSSFVGVSETPTAPALMSRFQHITWPTHVVDLLLCEGFVGLLTAGDVDFLRSLPR